jgi:hypothetical protein
MALLAQGNKNSLAKKKIITKNMTHHLNKEESFMAYIIVFQGKENPAKK